MVDAVSPDNLAVNGMVVERLRDISVRLLSLFVPTFSEEHCWPYSVENEKPLRYNRRFSISTTAMILHAIGVSTGNIRSSCLVPAVKTWRPIEAPTELSHITKVASGLLIRACGEPPDPVTASATWGDDDPLTMVWLYELARTGLRTDSGLELLPRLDQTARMRITDAFKSPDAPVLKGRTMKEGAAAITHVFPILRLVQLYKALLPGTDIDTNAVERWLTEQLHVQLSFSAIRDSEFDPAQLIFALEALLLANPDAVASGVAERVIEVLHTTHQRNPYLRPLRPLTINPQGLVLLPQSVEVANSLLRVCELLDRADTSKSSFSSNVDILLGYSSWLETRMIRGWTEEEIAFEGWQSEHTHAQGTVHLWASSQVLLFFQHHGAMLQQHLARKLRQQVGLVPARIKPLGQNKPVDFWNEASANEPLAGLKAPSRHRVYEKVLQHYVQPRVDAEGGEAHYSFILYGPPGTGKTSLAEDLARAVGYDLLTVTPSDFIESGEAGVEARARTLFEALTEQSDVVVLFDEIDRLVLSRDSDEYGSQSDMFQFMTPSMLTKLNNLRKGKQVIFLIATNYEERIDTAIKRSGRVDDRFLLVLPDAAQRKRIVTAEICRLRDRTSLLSQNALKQIVEATPLFAYQELKIACERGAGKARNDGELGRTILAAAHEITPAVSLGSYRRRFHTKSDSLIEDVSKGPLEEFLMLAYLVAEARRNVIEADWMRRVLERGIAMNLLEGPVKKVLAQELNGA